MVGIFLLLAGIRPPSISLPSDPAPVPSTSPQLDRPAEPLQLPLVAGIGRTTLALIGELPPHLADLEPEPGLLPVDLTADGRLLTLKGSFGEPVLVGPEARSPVPGATWAEVTLSPNGRRLALLDPVGRASVWELGAEADRPLDPGPFRAIHWSPDSRLLGLQSTEGYQVWDAMTGRGIFERPGRLLAVGPEVVAVWRDGTLLVEGFDGRVLRVFGDLSPSTTAGVPGGLFDPGGARLALPVLAADGPGLFLLHLSARTPERLTRGELIHPLFTWSGDGSELSWIDRGRLWRRTLSGAVVPGPPARPDGLVRLRTYDRALIPDGLLLLRRGATLVERSPIASGERLRSPPGSAHLVQTGPGTAVVGVQEPGRVTVRVVGTDPDGVPLTEAATAPYLEAAVSGEGTWAVAINAGIRLLTGGRTYGPLDSGSSPTFAGETVLYTDGDRILSIDTRRLPFTIRPVMETVDLPEALRILALGVSGDRVLVLAETPGRSSRLLALPLDPGGDPEIGGPAELARFASADTRLELSPDRTAFAVHAERATVFSPDAIAYPEGKFLAFSPWSDWVLLERAGGLVAVSTRGRGEIPLPGSGPDQAAWLDR